MILVSGGNGQLGQELALAAAVLGLPAMVLSRAQLDEHRFPLPHQG